MSSSTASVTEQSIYDEGLFYQLFDESELVRWKMIDYPWSSIREKDVSPGWRAVVREALRGELTTFSATERFFADFGADADFTQWLTVWLYEETKHPTAFLRWLNELGEKFDSRFMLQGRRTIPFMPSRMGTLAMNVISEMVASGLYVAVASRPNIEPVLRSICLNVGGDETRHASHFYRYAKKRLARSEDPNKEKVDALKVLQFWTTPELNRRVGHPVNLLVNEYRTNATVQEAVPLDVIEAAVENAHRRARRVFETLLELEIRSTEDINRHLTALEP